MQENELNLGGSSSESTTTPTIPTTTSSIDVEGIVTKAVEAALKAVSDQKTEAPKKKNKSQMDIILQEEEKEKEIQSIADRTELNLKTHAKVFTTVGTMGDRFVKLVEKYTNSSLNTIDESNGLLGEACFHFFKEKDNQRFIPTLYIDKVNQFLALDEFDRNKQAQSMYDTLVLSLDKLGDMKKQTNRANLSLQHNDNSAINYANKFMKRRNKLTSINYNDGYNMEAN